MTPDRLRAWISRNRVGAHWLRLRACGIDNEGTYVFQTWPTAGLTDDEHDVVQLIFDVAGDYADSVEEDARVAVEFLSEDDEVIASTVHKAKCTRPASVDAANASNVSSATIISQLLRHIETQQRVLSGGSIGALGAMERVLKMQSAIIEKQAAQNSDLASKLVALQGEIAANDSESESEDNAPEVAAARARAFDKLGELVPVVGAYMMEHIQAKAANGVAGAVHAAATSTGGNGN